MDFSISASKWGRCVLESAGCLDCSVRACSLLRGVAGRIPAQACSVIRTSSRMAPILFRIPLTIPFYGHADIPIYGFGIMLVLAFLSSPALAWWRARREGLDPDVILDMAFWVFVSGLIGARAFYCIQYWGTDIHNIWEALQYWRGGIVFYGGDRRRHGRFLRLPMRSIRFRSGPYLDAVAPSIALGTFFGRLGCFLNGCCFGDPCDAALGGLFPGRDLPPGITRSGWA